MHTLSRIARATILAAAAASLLSSIALGQANSLTDDVTRLISARKMGEARVGVSIVDTETASALASVHADEAFTPASNMKLLTSGASMFVLGPDFVFKTEIIQDGRRLIVKGSGDPALADPAVLDRMEPRMTVSDVLALLAGAVSKVGMAEVREIVIDDRVFDREFVHPAWPAEQLDRGYCAQVSGVGFHANVLSVFPRPNPDGLGTPPLYSLEPDARWLRIDVKARTVTDGRNSAWLTREEGGNHLTLRGDVRYPTQVPIDVTIHGPGEFFGLLLADQIARTNITVAPRPGGQAHAVRLVDDTEAVPDGRVIAVVRTALDEVLLRCNSDSENLYAESLLKLIGHSVTKEPGSWSNGASVLRMILTERLGPKFAASTVISDGSGLSRENAVAPGTLAQWLHVIAKEDTLRDPFTQSLATPGKGTLKRRFSGVKLANSVYAKSGFINGVRCLSGYVVNEASGRRVCFSVMVNDIKSDDQTREALALHEDVVQLIDRWLSKRIAAEEPAVGG